jgi:TrmH family RNA methyltransferase
VRVADAAGADAVVVAGDSADPFGGKAVRASAGSIFHLPVVVVRDPLAAVSALRRAGLAVLATAVDGTLLDPVALPAPVAWLFGSEAHGLPADVVSAADRAVRIPIFGAAESLNVASAAAVCLYASAFAQRRA